MHGDQDELARRRGVHPGQLPGHPEPGLAGVRDFSSDQRLDDGIDDATRATRDLDAVFIPTDVVRQAAAAVAERERLAEDWLNDAVKGFLPGPDPDAQRFYSSDSLIVDVASPRYLLAMKLFAARAEIDADDIVLLYRKLGFTTVDEGLDLVEHAYPGRPIPAKVKFLLAEIVDSM